MFLLTAGFCLYSNKLSDALSDTKYFFSDNSYSIQSEIEADISATISYNLDIYKASLMASSYFSTNSNTDFFIGAQLTKSIHTNDKSLEITPTIAAHAGS